MTRTTKAQEALAEAREWIVAAEEEVRERETALTKAQQQLEMHRTIYDVLEKTLTRRKPAVRPATKSSIKKPSKKRQGLPAGEKRIELAQMCAFAYADGGGQCNQMLDNPIHDLDGGYTGYHPFVAPSSAPTAAHPSSANGGEGSTTANSGTLTESAGDARSAVNSGDFAWVNADDPAHAASGE
jgi:hypothetical protein